jgi:hypothetical protein
LVASPRHRCARSEQQSCFSPLFFSPKNAFTHARQAEKRRLVLELNVWPGESGHPVEACKKLFFFGWSIQKKRGKGTEVWSSLKKKKFLNLKHDD